MTRAVCHAALGGDGSLRNSPGADAGDADTAAGPSKGNHACMIRLANRSSLPQCTKHRNRMA